MKSFGFLSLERKIRYFREKLRFGNADIWIDQGIELWRDIDTKRQAIVHGEEVPDISSEYLLKGVNYFQRAMLVICVNAQARQGVPFRWGMMSALTKRQTPATLRPSVP